ncbi:MAG: YdcF family protein [Oscillospiraceae bacterium]|nr:YdcF family protein [Oscillospiraceae bacterium]
MAKPTKHKRNWFKSLLIVMIFSGICVAILTLVINLHIKSSVKGRIKTVDDLKGFNADCILVLGAGIYNETTPSLMLADRIDIGISLYNAGVSDRILMSGDNGNKTHNEVGAMRYYALDKGIDSHDIFLDHAGFSTYESIYRAKYIFGAQKIVIVTQGFHIERALYIAEKFGIEAYGTTSDLHNYGTAFFNESRDILARVKDFFMVIFRPKPTFLGDTISLRDNGEITIG